MDHPSQHFMGAGSLEMSVICLIPYYRSSIAHIRIMHVQYHHLIFHPLDNSKLFLLGVTFKKYCFTLPTIKNIYFWGGHTQ